MSPKSKTKRTKHYDRSINKRKHLEKQIKKNPNDLQAVAELKKQYGEIGSGYPSDPYTKAFLKSKGNELKYSGIFRKSWATWKALFPDAKQKTLDI